MRFRKTLWMVTGLIAFVVTVSFSLIAVAQSLQRQLLHENVAAAEQTPPVSLVRDYDGIMPHPFSETDRFDWNEFVRIRALIQKEARLADDVVNRITFAVLQAAADYGLEPDLLLAIIRRESRFNPHTFGAAGEIGLMQILPATARFTARRLDWPQPTRDELYRIDVNLRYGSAHLAYLLDKYDGDEQAALTAYNAGNARSQAGRRYAANVLAMRDQFVKQSPPALAAFLEE